MLLATSLAACTKCLLATGLLVLLLATLQALHRTLVCFAITVAAASTYKRGGGGVQKHIIVHKYTMYTCC